MSSVQTPQEKKRLAYERDHYAKGKSEKAFRKGWPTKKRKANHSFRRAANVLATAATLDEEADVRIGAIKKNPLIKDPVPTLGQLVPGKLAKRGRRIGRKKARRAAAAAGRLPLTSSASLSALSSPQGI
jgi:hypothetical protein